MKVQSQLRKIGTRSPLLNPYITKLLVGQVRELGSPDAVDPMDRPWSTGIFKAPVEDELWLSQTGLENDAVADTKNHGGPEKALFAYPVAHYDYWRTLPGMNTISMGGMGENLAVDGATEDTICLGDIFQFRHALIQISQPRQPCWKPARRYKMKDLALKTQQSGRTGWYFRVLQEGYVKGDTKLILIERPTPEWTIAVCNQVMHDKTNDLNLAAELAQHASLAQSWKRTLNNQICGKILSADKRLYGENAEG